MLTRDDYRQSWERKQKWYEKKKRAIVAIAHSIVIIAYHLVLDKQPYRELGGDYFDRRRPEATARRLLQRLEHLGYKATVQSVLQQSAA
jgi:hypothetical protein